MQDDETLISRYLDGELSSQARLDFEKRLVEDNEFAQLFREYEKLDSAIINQYTDIDETPIAPELIALLADSTPSDTTVDSPSTETDKEHRSKSYFRKLLPLAAAVMSVAFILPLVFNQDKQHFTQITEALDSKPSGQQIELADSSTLTIQMTFENNEAQLCREYVIAKNDTQIARQVIACNVNQDWQEMLTAEVKLNNTDTFQPASGNSSAEIEAWLDSNMRSDAYTIEQELAALKAK